MSETNILALIIHVPLNLETNEALGIYNIGSTCQIRLSETELYLSLHYTHGYIAKDGVGAITHNSDFSTGGNTIHANDVSITLVNKNKYHKALLQLGINLTGLKVQIREYIGTPSAQSSVSADDIFTGFISDLEWDSTTISFNLKSNLAEARRANLGKVITKETHPYAPDSNLGKILPVMFGNSDPLNGRFFTIPRTNAKNIMIRVVNFDVQNNYGEQIPGYPPEMFEFPAYDTPPSGYDGVIAVGQVGLSYVPSQETFEGKYLLCIEGDSGSAEGTGNQDKYRKILSCWVERMTDRFDQCIVTFVTQDYFPKTVIGNHSFNADKQHWFKLFEIVMEYETGASPISGFFDSTTGVKLSQFPEIYGKVGDAIKRILSHGCDIQSANNKLIFNPRIFNGSIDKLLSIDTTPITDISIYKGDNLDVWGLTGYSKLDKYPSGKIEGAYFKPTWGSADNDSVESGAANIYDRSLSTYFNYTLSAIKSVNEIVIPLILKLPEIPQGIEFNNVYLGIKANILIAGNYTLDSSKFIVKKRGHYRPFEDVATKSGINYYTPGVSISSLPDYYYNPPLNNKNKDFFVQAESSSELTGYEAFSLKVTSRDEYESIEELCLVIYSDMNSNTSSNYNLDIKIYELAVIYQNEQDIEEKIYA
jgi:hypothetical protein